MTAIHLPSRRAPTQPVAVQGQLQPYDTARPPIIVNPQVEADALMSWGVDQLRAVNILLAAMAARSESFDAQTLAGAVAHLTVQAEVVIRAALKVHRDSFIG